MPPVNDKIANAILLDETGDSHSGTTVGSDVSGATWEDNWHDTWYKVVPAVSGVYAFTIEDTSGNAASAPDVDIYRSLVGGVPTAWSDLEDTLFSVYTSDDSAGPVRGTGTLLNGETYYFNFYLYDDVYVGGPGPEGTYEIAIEPANTPANDNFANATVIGPGTTVISGTTVDATTEPDEVDLLDDSGTPSVWYKVVIAGPGVFGFKINSVGQPDDPDTGLADCQWLYQTGTGIADLQSEYVFDKSSAPDFLYYDLDSDQPGGELNGGEVFYFRVVNSLYDGAAATVDFTLTFITQPLALCLDAQDYLNGASTTASIVSGNVRETAGFHPSEQDPWKSFIGDGIPTLIIPGADIVDGDGPGFYAVTLHCETSTNFGYCGLLRNGQPLWPGSEIDKADPDPVTNWLTVPAGEIGLDGATDPFQLIWYLPVQSGDTIELVFYATYGSDGDDSTDISQICFQRMVSAVEGPAYDVLDIPEYPLGTISADIGTAEQQGDIIVGKTTAPTFTEHALRGHDIVVTDDGVIWIAHIQDHRAGAANGTTTGPVLHCWDPSSPGWTLISDDVEGLGTKYASSFSGLYHPYSLSLATDGEDVWICYGIDGGPAIGGGRNWLIRVKKYDVSGASFSNLGSPFTSPEHTLGGRSEGGGFNDTAVIKISPAGVPWISFTDLADADPATDPLRPGLDLLGYYPYVGYFNGSTWVIDRLPMPLWFEEYNDGVVHEQASGHIFASGTTSSVTEDGESCVKDTQTSGAADTVRWIPPAGNWSVYGLRLMFNKTSGLGAVRADIYKNGSSINPTSFPHATYGVNDLGTGPTWALIQTNDGNYYHEFNGTTDEIEIRLYCNGTATEVFIDEIVLFNDHQAVVNRGFGAFDARFSDGDAKASVPIWMHRVGETGLGENPGALYNTASVKFTTDSGEEGYVPPDVSIGSYAIAYQWWVYSEYNGSTWDKLWEGLIEEFIPDGVMVHTLTDSYASTPPFGHFCEGFSFDTDGIDNYCMSAQSGGQAFGFFGDSIATYKITSTGMELLGNMNTPGGIGYPQGVVFGLGGFSGWGYYNHPSGIRVGPDGNIWTAWDSVSAPDDFPIFMGHYVPNGICDWFSAGLTQETIGYSQADHIDPAMAISPDGETIYVFTTVYVGVDSNSIRPTIAGVWEMPVIHDAKIPLIPIAGGAIPMYWRVGEEELTTEMVAGR